MDAARFPGGRADAVAFPRNEAEVSRLVRDAAAVLPIGAQSSLTGGATPRGGLVLSTSRLTVLEPAGAGLVRAGAGVPLSVLQEALERKGQYYPPIPTFAGAFVGGLIATNAAGAATFKYGSTRRWVEALTVVLASGEVLDVQRGKHVAGPDGMLEIDTRRGRVRIPAPTYAMPSVAKLAAGYFARRGMDLVDLFIGSEGTLGVVTSVTLRVLPEVPSACWALVFTRDDRQAIDLAERLRSASLATRAAGDPLGIDAAGIEYMDERSLRLVREDRADRRCHVDIPPDAGAALLVQLEGPRGLSREEAYGQLTAALEPTAADSALRRFCRMIAADDLLDSTQVALPGDTARAAELLAFREAVPAGVNQRIAAAGSKEPAIHKVAGDPIVPVERLAEFLSTCRRAFAARGLDAAIWGHISDGNLHPNVIPESARDVSAAGDAVLEIGRAAMAMGGSPLAEHGVGRHPIKQMLLRELYGDEGIEQMRRVKRALDPDWKLAPGVIFGMVEH
jgi:D-lactate dehydrogenase (cytochrome)